MVRLAIVNEDGKILSAKDIATAKDLHSLVEQARTIIRDCERLARQPENAKIAPTITGKVPYSS